MSSAIDERIVAMRFENQQFEKGAKESLKTLEELKKSCDFEGVTEGFDKLSKASKDSFGFKDATRQTNLFSRAMKGLGNVAAYPFQALTSGLKEFNGYLRTYLGFDLASKLVNTGRQVMRTFSIDPMKTGWNEYELKMDSIKTIMTGTSGEYKKLLGDQYTEEAHLEIVNKKLEELNKYADDTIYSFQDMTSNIGKFTNNGVKLEHATTAIMGVSNAAAQAGQGANEASRAMYNLSQAIGMGKLTTIDWKSIENANMATLEFKDAFIKVGESLGTLKKQGDKFFTTTGKRLEVTAENFRETLSSGWVNKDVLVATLAAYSGEYDAISLMQEFGIKEDVAKELVEIGEAAKKSATEVRTFSKMFEALKEAAQSGWAISWEFIFGNMKEGSNFWKDLNERFSKMLEDAANKRNDLLRGWRGQVMDTDRKSMENAVKQVFKSDYYKNQYGTEAWFKAENGVASIVGDIIDHFDKNGTAPEKVDELIGVLNKKYKLKEEDALRIVSELSEKYNELDYVGKDGREDFTAGVNNIIDAFINLKDTWTSIKKAVFGETTAAGLQTLTEKFAQITGKIKDFTAAIKEGETFEVLKKIFEGLASALRMVWGSVKKLGSLFGSILGPIGEFLLDIFAKVGEWLKGVSGKTILETITNIIAKLKTLTKVKVAEWFKKVTTSISSLFKTIKTKVKNWAVANGLGNVVDIFTRIWESIKTGWESAKKTIQESEALKAIGKFFSNIWAAIMDLFTGTGDKEEAKHPEENAQTEANKSNNIFSDIWIAIENGWNTAKDAASDIIKAIGQFFTNIWNAIISIFHEENGGLVENTDAPVEAEEQANQSQSVFEKIWSKIEAGWEVAKKVFSNVILAIGRFFTNIWNAIISIFHEENGGLVENTDVPVEAEEQANQSQSVFEKIWSKIEAGWEAAKNAFISIIRTIGSFFANVFNAIAEIFHSEGNSTSKEKAALEAEEQADESEGTFTRIWNKITTAWETALGKVREVLRIIGAFFVDVFNTIVELFRSDSGSSKEDAVANAETQANNSSTVFGDIFKAVKDGWDAAVQEAGTIIKAIGKFLTNVFGAIIDIFKPSEASAETIPAEEQAQNSKSKFDIIWGKITAAWAMFVDELKKSRVLSAIGTFFTNVFSYIRSIFVQDEGESAEEFPEPETVDSAESKFNKYWQPIKTAWDNIIKVIKEVALEIAKFFSNAWTFLEDMISGSGKEPEKAIGEEEMSFLDVYTPDESNYIEKVSVLERIFSVLSEFVGKVQGWTGWEVIGQFLRDVGAMFRDIVGTLAEAAFGDDVVDTVTNLLQAVLAIINQISDYLRLLADPEYGTAEQKSKAKLISWVIAGLAIILEAIGKFGTGTGLFSLGLGSELMGLGIGILALAGAISILGRLNIDEIKQGGIAVAALGAILYFLIPVISNLIGSITKLRKVGKKGIAETIVDSIVGHGSLLLGLLIIMKSLPEIIGALASAKKEVPDLSGKDLLDTFLGIAALIGTVVISVGVISLIGKLKVDPLSFLTVMANILQFVTEIGLAMIALGAGIRALYKDEEGKLDVDELREDLRGFVVLVETIGELLGAFFGSISGAAVGSYSAKKQEKTTEAAINSGKALFEAFEDFSMEDFDKLERISDVIGSLTKKISDPNLWDRWFNGAKTYKELPDVFASVGTALNSFIIMCNETYHSVGGKEGLEAADVVFDYLESIGRIAMMASLVSEKYNGYSTSDILTSFFMAFSMNDAGKPTFELSELQDSIQYFSSLADMINSAFIEAAPNINVKPMIQAIAQGILSKESKDTILEAFQNIGQWMYEEYGIDTSYVTNKLKKEMDETNEEVTEEVTQKTEELSTAVEEKTKEANQGLFGGMGLLGGLFALMSDPSKFSFLPSASAEDVGFYEYINSLAKDLNVDLSDFSGLLVGFGLPEIDFSNPESIVEGLKSIAGELKGAISSFLGIPDGETILQFLSEGLSSEEAAQFFTNLNEILDPIKKLSQMTPEEFQDYAKSYISAIFTALDESYKETLGNQSLVEYLFGSDIASSVESFGPFTEENLKAKTKGMVVSLMEGLKEAISEDADLSVVANYIQSAMTLNAEDAKMKAKEYVKAALEGVDEALSESKSGQLILTVAPVLASNEKFIEALVNGGKLDASGVINIASESLAPVMADIIASADQITSNNTEQTSRIIASINSLAGRIAGVESAIMGINIVLDTGAIAGVVDDRLGRKKQSMDRSQFSYRGGSR